MQTLSMAEKAIPSHVAPITLLNASPITFSLVHPDRCSPYTLHALFYLRAFVLAIPCPCHSPPY